MKKSIVMASFLAWITSLFGCGKQESTPPEPADVYSGLRQQILTLDPSKAGVVPTDSNRVWGVLMEMGRTDAVATLVTLGDGTVSLYFSNGGGIIGLGQHDGPRIACAEFLSLAPNYVSYASPTQTYPLPGVGHMRFYFLTFDGILTVEAKEEDLVENRHALSPFFYKANEVITQARLVDEKLRAEQDGGH